MSPVEGGDKRYVRKEYALADEYNENLKEGVKIGEDEQVAVQELENV